MKLQARHDIYPKRGGKTLSRAFTASLVYEWAECGYKLWETVNDANGKHLAGENWLKKNFKAVNQ